MAKTPEPQNRRDSAAAAGGDDDALWRHFTESVRPLRHRPPPPPDSPAPKTPPAKTNPVRRPARPAPAVAPPPPPPARPVLPEIGHGDVAGVDKRTAQRMRRGQLPIEARIDLHGLTEAEAHRTLASFLIGSQKAGRRCVLVVTGKGLRPDGGTGVLRTNVPRWLNAPPNRGRILAFSHAQPKDGGEGALYVLLKRRKTSAEGTR